MYAEDMHSKDNHIDGLSTDREAQPKHARGLSRAFEILADLPDDFLHEGRGDRPAQTRQPNLAN